MKGLVRKKGSYRWEIAFYTPKLICKKKLDGLI
jgi:hypothetical protein